MKQVYFLLVIGFLIVSCETEGFDNPGESPVFEGVANLDGDQISFQAGLEGVENIPGVVEQDNQLTYFSYFNIPSTGSGNKKLTLQFKQYPKVITEAIAKSEILNEELDYVLSYTGVEGVKVTPQIGSIADIYTEMWAIDGQIITTQANALVPNPVLQDKGFVDVRYNLNILGKFAGSVNSQISKVVEESCNGKLDIITNVDHADITFNSANPQLNQIEWGTGETSNNVQISLAPQTVFAEVSSPECTMNVQMDITDPSSLPTELGFDIEVVEGPATGQPTQGFVLEFIDEQGELFRSDFGIQNQNAQIKIEEVKPYNIAYEGNSVLIVRATIDATLFNLSQTKNIELTEGEITFSFAHPMN